MLSIVKTAGKALGLYLVKAYLLSVVYDLIVEALEKLAKKTDTNIDDELVASLKKDKEKVLAVIKGA